MCSNAKLDLLQCAVQLSQKDDEILTHLTNIECEELEPEEDEDGDELAGFRLSFHFDKNPFFDHDVLVSSLSSCISTCVETQLRPFPNSNGSMGLL